MDFARRFSLTATAGLLGIAVMLGWVSARPATRTLSVGTAAQLDRATAWFDSTIVLARNSVPRGARGDELAIALGLLERQRLGLGSPFRLVDEALDDPRLDPPMRNRVAWALLGRLRRGDAYVVDPMVLDGSGPWTADGRGATGAAHLGLIEHAIRSASDPRAGEVAVRLAYLLAAAKGTVAAEAVMPAAQVAALLRDRELASRDLHDLFADASRLHIDPLQLVSERRAAHGFRVEAPPMAPLPSALRIEAMSSVPALVHALDTLDRVAARSQTAATASVLGTSFAARLGALGAERPPQADIVVTLHGYQKDSFHASNEETLTAWSAFASSDATGYGSYGAVSDSARRQTALALVSSAVALRTLAQAAPWFPGDDGPDVTDLTSEFGLADVSFSRAVPAAWRPYYLRELRDALRDMQDVFPALNVRGLRIQFSADDMRDSALAMHNPRTRALELSIMTSGGTIAHELAHDLDWQAARRLYVRGGGYSTDRAMREQRGPLASSVRGLADARILRPAGGLLPPPPMADRPAELFARGADWFVASTLAARGRTNGFLTAVQDVSLSGYAAGPPTAVGSAAATALLSAIEQITFLPDSSRDAFEAQWADPEVVDPVLVARRVLETPLAGGTAERWNGGTPAHRSVFGVPLTFRSTVPPFHRSTVPSPSLCVAEPTLEAVAREHLVLAAADARARGTALRRALYRPPESRPAWALSVLGVSPASPQEGERIVDAIRAAVVAGLANALPNQGVLPLVPPIFLSSASSCASSSR